jgi:hypothetical protein
MKAEFASFDISLAAYVAQGLTELLGGYSEQPEGMERARDIFTDYANRDNHDDPLNFFAFDQGNERADDFDWALVWLAANFRALWD